MRYFSLSQDCQKKKDTLISEYANNLGMAIMRRKAMIALKAARMESEMALRARTEFVASMSHELRTPLNAIIGFSELLGTRSAENPEQVREYAGYINEAAKHLLELINQVLDISKIHSGRMELSIGQVDVAEQVRHCLQLIMPRAAEGGVTMREELPEDLPVIEGDETRIRQIILNLLSNAVKFTPRGGEVTAACAWLEEQGMMEIRICDTGEGMTPQEVARACEPFEQIHDQLKKKHEGTGLGLPISIAIAEMHGGRLEISSRKGEGTCIRVLLPHRQAANGKTGART